MRLRALCVVVVVWLACAPTAYANDGSVGTQGGTVVPIANDAVRMDSESVQIVCLDGYALYRIDFKFVNESEAAQTVKLGFPFPDYESAEENTGEPPGGFRAWHDGKELVVKPVRGRDSYSDGSPKPVIWFTHTATFQPGESMITVHYAGAPDVSVAVPEFLAGTGLKGEDGYGLGFYPYHVHTGAGWSGTIGLSVIRYTLADDFDGAEVATVTRNLANAEWMQADRRANLLAFTNPDPNTFQWVHRDYEPTHAHDPEIAFAKRWDSGTWAEPSASSHLKLGEYEYPAWMASDRSPGTAWAEASEGSGIGEWLKLDLGERTAVREIRVFPGYQKRADLFKKYNRPSKLEVEFDDGSSEVLELRDEVGMQTFPARAEAKSVKVTILDVYEGTNDRNETYLSEISFASSPAPLFDTFEAVTGIKPAAGFVEPAALAPLTRGADALQAGGPGGEPFDPGTEGAVDSEDAVTESGGARGWVLAAVGAFVLVAAGVIVGWGLSRRRGTTGESGADAQGSTPPP